MAAPSDTVARGRSLLRCQYVVLLAWGGLLAGLTAAAWFSLYKLVVLMMEYSRALEDAKRQVVQSDDLFNAAGDDEDASGADDAKARVPTGREIMRRLRQLEGAGGGRSALLTSLDSSQDDWSDKKAADGEEDA